MNLIQAIGKVPMNGYYHIGSQSGFCFIVDRAEFNNIVPADWKLREVIKIYKVSHGYAFICEGYEIAKSWFREEFEKELEKYAKNNDISVFYHPISGNVRYRKRSR